MMMIGLAIITGITATALTGFYVTSTIKRQAQGFKEDFDAKQKQVVAQLQQQSDQKLAAFAQQMKKSSDDQNETLKRQIVDLQTRVQTQKSMSPVKRAKPSLAVKTPQGKRR